MEEKYKLTYEEVHKLYDTMSKEEKLVYRYNPSEENGFVGKEETFFDPVESQITGKIILLTPADCTPIKAPERKDGMFIHFDKEASKWVESEDLKGKCWYDIENKKNRRNRKSFVR